MMDVQTTTVSTEIAKPTYKELEARCKQLESELFKVTEERDAYRNGMFGGRVTHGPTPNQMLEMADEAYKETTGHYPPSTEEILASLPKS